MRIRRFLGRLVFLNLFVFLYLHQQLSLLRVSYEVREREAHLASLHDENRILRSEFLQMVSPGELEKRVLLSQGGLRLPEAREIVRLAVSPSPPASSLPSPGNEPRPIRSFLSFLTFRSQAEARTVE